MVDQAANALVDKCSRKSFATVSTMTAAAAADSRPPPATQPAPLLSHRPPQSPASPISCSSAAAAVAARADSDPPLAAQPTALSSPQSPASPLSSSGVVAASVAGDDSYAQLPAVVNSSSRLPRKPSGDVDHHIVTRGLPLACCFCGLDGEKLAVARKEFLRMEKDGIVRRSISQWSSPLHMVQRPDGS
jgi:hypothetical protein